MARPQTTWLGTVYRSLFRKNRVRTKRLVHTLVLLDVGCVLLALAAVVRPFHSINLWLSDQLFTSEPPSPNIVILGVDDRTLATYGKWSEWPRLLHATAIDNLKKAGARVVAFDVLFVDRSEDDAVLANSEKSAGNVVLAVAGADPIVGGDSAGAYSRLLQPTAALGQASQSTGHINITPDPDGKVRRLPLIIRSDLNQARPALAVAALFRQFGQQLPAAYAMKDGAVNLLGRRVPVDPRYNLRINFAASPESYPYVSYGDVITGDFDPSLVKNKVVLVGMTATGELDAWPVPGSAGKVPGVFIHAAAADTILRQRFLVDSSVNFTSLTIILLTLLLALALPRLRIRWGTTVTAVLIAGYAAFGFVAFDRGYVLNLLYPLSAMTLIYGSSIMCQVAIAQSDKRLVRDLFGRYVSPQVAKEIVGLADTGKLRLGGEQRAVTVMFADIRNYTRISESLSPTEVVSMLNVYLSIAIDEVLKNGGMVNKFAGDNIMAVWNAPQSEADHARLGIKAALATQQRVAALKNDPLLPKVQFGIGLNTGEALAGNVGSAGRAEYTVIGDTVNLASRICSGTPGGEVWIGPQTRQQAGDSIEVEDLGPQTFKGKSEPITVYRVKSVQ